MCYKDLISRFTLDSATEFLFGSCVHSLSSVLPYPHHAPSYMSKQSATPAEDFARAFAEAQEATNFRLRMGMIWAWWELFSSKTKGPMRVVDSFLDPILKAAVAKAERMKLETGPPSEISEDDTLLDHLVKYTKGTGTIAI
jgi:hypothetical protein